MKTVKELTEQYLKAAKEKDASALDRIFTEDAVYCESSGATYRGLEQIKKWFGQVTTIGSVIEWRYTTCVETGGIGAVEWYFEYQITGGDLFKIDGVSMVELQNGKLKSWREFTQVSDKTYPLE